MLNVYPQWMCNYCSLDEPLSQSFVCRPVRPFSLPVFANGRTGPGVEFTSRLSVVFWLCVFITTNVARVICLIGKSTWKLHHFTMQTSVVKCGNQHKCLPMVFKKINKKIHNLNQLLPRFYVLIDWLFTFIVRIPHEIWLATKTLVSLVFYNCLILQDVHACCAPDKGEQRQGGLTDSCWWNNGDTVMLIGILPATEQSSFH